MVWHNKTGLMYTKHYSNYTYLVFCVHYTYKFHKVYYKSCIHNPHQEFIMILYIRMYVYREGALVHIKIIKFQSKEIVG